MTTTVTVTTPVDFVELDLPATDGHLVLTASGVLIENDGGIWYLFSADGGVTYPSDLVNYDSYNFVRAEVTGTAPTGSGFDDALGHVCGQPAAGTVANSSVLIYPGASGQNASSVSTSWRKTPTTGLRRMEIVHCVYNENEGIQNRIRIGGYDKLTGNGGGQLLAGTFTIKVA